MSLLAGGAKEATSLGIRLSSFRGVVPEESDVTLGVESMDSAGSGGGTSEAVVTGERERRALFTIGNETEADVVTVEATGGTGTEVIGNVTGADVVTVEVTEGTGMEVTEANVTDTVAEVDFFKGQLRDRCPVCSHRKHCSIWPR